MSLVLLPVDVQYLIVNDYLCNKDALVLRCTCSTWRALVPHARIKACHHRLYVYFCKRGYLALMQWSRLLAGERLCAIKCRYARRMRASYAKRPQKVAISRCCSGYMHMTRCGMRTYVQKRPEAVISRCCNGAACSQASGCTRQRRAVEE